MINLYEAMQHFPPARRLSCRGLLFTNYECPQVEKTQQFLVERSHIAYVLSGRRIFHKNGQRWELKEGSCFFVRNGIHLAEKPDEEGWCVMVFFMPDEFLKRLFRENRKDLPVGREAGTFSEHVLALHVNELSRTFFLSMLPYFSQDPPPPEHLLELKFKELVLSLLSDRENALFLSYLNNLADDNYSSLEEIMQNNFSCHLTLADFAKLTCKSIPSFKREFRKRYQQSPAKWVMNKRMQLATELLQNSRLSIGEITGECGFENQAHFSRVFKQKLGVTPSRFRQSAVNKP